MLNVQSDIICVVTGGVENNVWVVVLWVVYLGYNIIIYWDVNKLFFLVIS